MPKAQKDSQFKHLYLFLGPGPVKAACKHVDEIDPRSIFWGSWGSIENWLKPKIKLSNQVELVKIPDTHDRLFFFHNIICIRTNFIKKTINFENLEQNFKVAQYVECSKIIGGELATEGQFPYQVRTF